MNDINRCFMSKTLNAFSQNCRTRSYWVLPRSPSTCQLVSEILYWLIVPSFFVCFVVNYTDVIIPNGGWGLKSNAVCKVKLYWVLSPRLRSTRGGKQCREHSIDVAVITRDMSTERERERERGQCSYKRITECVYVLPSNCWTEVVVTSQCNTVIKTFISAYVQKQRGSIVRGCQR